MNIIYTRIVLIFSPPLDLEVVAKTIEGFDVDWSVQSPKRRQYVVLVEEDKALYHLQEFLKNAAVQDASFDTTGSLDGSIAIPVPNDPLADDQWAIKSMNVPAAHRIQSGASGVVVGVVDIGIDATNPEFAENNITAFGSGGSKVHGTTCASCLAANSGNGVGVIGNAPGITLRDYDCFNLSHTIIQSAIENAIALEVPILSNSWSFPTSSADSYFNALIDEYTANGGLFIRSASNSGSETANIWPQNSNQMIVGSVGPGDVKSTFSNYGPWVDIVAPGENILSTYPGGGFGYWDGTSASCPHVAGVAALVKSENINLYGWQIRNIVQETANAVPRSSFSLAFTKPGGIGSVNALKAVLKARSTKTKYKNTIIPCINFIGLSTTIDAGIATTQISGLYFTELLCYGDKWDNSTGTLTLKHGESVLYSGGVAEVSKEAPVFPEPASTISTEAGFTALITSGVGFSIDTSTFNTGDASIKFQNDGAGTKYVEFSIDADVYKTIGFKVYGTLETDYEYSSSFQFIVNGEVKTVLSSGTGLATSVSYNWDDEAFELRGYSGICTIRMAFVVVENYQNKSLWVDNIYFGTEYIYDVPEISIGEVTGDLLLIAESDGARAGYRIPLNGEPTLLSTGAEQVASTIELDAWTGATTSYKWDDAPTYSTYTEPLAITGTTLSFYSEDAGFSELPMVYTVQTDFDAPVVVSDRLAGAYAAGTLITLYEPTPDVSQPVVIYYRWDLGAWQTYSAPIEVQDGVLWWYAVDSVDNQSEVSHLIYSFLQPIKTPSGASGGQLKTINGASGGTIKTIGA